MGVLFTQEYLATARMAHVEVTYPDGACYASEVLDDGNGYLAGMIRTTLHRPERYHELSRSLDSIRASHARVASTRKGSAWAAPR